MLREGAAFLRILRRAGMNALPPGDEAQIDFFTGED
jgi:hypothetical protein